MQTPPRLSIVFPDGRELGFSHADLRALPSSSQVADVGLLVPGKSGRGVWLEALIGKKVPAAHLGLISLDPNFAVSLPWEQIPHGALVLYEQAGEPLASSKGGPFRFLVPGHSDECVHVKQLQRIELRTSPGRDTRPVDDEEHQKLHQKKAQR